MPGIAEEFTGLVSAEYQVHFLTGPESLIEDGFVMRLGGPHSSLDAEVQVILKLWRRKTSVGGCDG